MVNLTLGDHPKNSISLYFHIPFCTKKCAYCHFYVLPDKDPLKIQLMEGLRLEWEKRLPLLRGKNILTIYFGGGTPFLLGPPRIAEILDWIALDLHCDLQTVEITLEANPENISLELMQDYAQAGINRVSIGIQTLDEAILKALGRLHSPKTALNGVYTTAQAGIANISIDLMYDLPLQTKAIWKDTLDQIAELPIAHLSLYNLTIEPHTLFFKNQNQIRSQLPDEQASLEMYEAAVEKLEEKGLKQYEISAFAKGGAYSKHNTGYWKGRPFLGFGPSAFSYWEGKRLRNSANLSQYSKALKGGLLPVDFEERLAEEERKNELLAINLRLTEGVHLEEFQDKHGKLSQNTLENIKKLHNSGLISLDDEIVKLTKRGILFYDTVAVELI